METLVIVGSNGGSKANFIHKLVKNKLSVVRGNVTAIFTMYGQLVSNNSVNSKQGLESYKEVLQANIQSPVYDSIIVIMDGNNIGEACLLPDIKLFIKNKEKQAVNIELVLFSTDQGNVDAFKRELFQLLDHQDQAKGCFSFYVRKCLRPRKTAAHHPGSEDIFSINGLKICCCVSSNKEIIKSIHDLVSAFESPNKHTATPNIKKNGFCKITHPDWSVLFITAGAC